MENGADKLKWWLDHEGRRKGWLADKVGVSRVTLWRFLDRQSIPDLAVAVKIEDVTEGLVPCQSWVAK